MSDIPVIEIGGMRLRGPEQRGGRWFVDLVDPVLETAEEKMFGSKGKAQTFIDELVSGQPPVDPLVESAGTPVVRKGVVSERPEPAPAPPQLNRSHTRQLDPQQSLPKDPAKAKFNLGAVRDVLERYELDPFAEIAEVLQATKQVVVRDEESGAIIGAKDVPLIEGIDRAKILVELGQYVAPKLKAVEMKVKDLRDMPDDEVAKRIAALQAKEAKT